MEKGLYLYRNGEELTRFPNARLAALPEAVKLAVIDAQLEEASGASFTVRVARGDRVIVFLTIVGDTTTSLSLVEYD